MVENLFDATYADMLRTAMRGQRRQNRTGIDTFSTFGGEWRFDLSQGFPLLTTKKMFTKSIFVELLWFLQGRTDLRYLLEHGVHIWSANAHDQYVKRTGSTISLEEYEDRVLTDKLFASEDGNLGRIYGKQWRHWCYVQWLDSGGVGRSGVAYMDQLQNAVQTLRTNPDSRRIIVSAWNPGEIDGMALPPCHCFFQMNSRPLTEEQLRNQLYDTVREHEEHYASSQIEHADYDKLVALCEWQRMPTRALDLKLHQRSADVFLGVPFNIASYALLTMILAQITGHTSGEFIHSFGDLHIYENHVDQAREQLSRDSFPAPTLKIDPKLKELDDFVSPDAFTVVGYKHHPTIKAPMAV